MEKMVGLALIAAGVLMTVLFVVPRMTDGFQMTEGSLCSAGETRGCIQEVQATVEERDHGITKEVGPVRWQLAPRGGEEEILSTPWLGEELVVGSHVTLQLWEGDPIAVRNRGDEVHSLAWGVNRWILWAAAALALMLPGFTLVSQSFRSPTGDDRDAYDAWTVATTQVMLSAVGAMAMYPAFSGAGFLGALVVLGGHLWFAGRLFIHGPRQRRLSGSHLRGLA